MERDLTSCINAKLVLKTARILSETELRLFSHDVSDISPIHEVHSKDSVFRSAFYCVILSNATHTLLESLLSYLKAYSEVLRPRPYHRPIGLLLATLYVGSWTMVPLRAIRTFGHSAAA